MTTALRSIPPLVVCSTLGAAGLVAGLAFGHFGHCETSAPAATPIVAVAAPAPRTATVVTTANKPRVVDVADANPLEPDALDPEKLAFVVTAGKVSYLQLAPLDADVPHGALHMLSPDKDPADDNNHTVTASIADRDVPVELRKWTGRTVVFPDTQCTARVTGFAIYSAASGMPEYADDGHTWTAEAVFSHGDPTLVGRLELDPCKLGTATWARASSAPAPVRAEADQTWDGLELASVAADDLMSTEEGVADNIVWNVSLIAHDQPLVPLVARTRVVRNPTTQVRWIYATINLTGESCSADPSFDLTAVYRDAGDGTLERVYLGPTALHMDSPMIDLRDDGRFEILDDGDTVGDPYDRAIATRRGGTWYGCPC